jgi:hypothetical protein
MATSGKAPQIRLGRIAPHESSPKRTPLFVCEEFFC